jgi:hypothetical protein
VGAGPQMEDVVPVPPLPHTTVPVSMSATIWSAPVEMLLRPPVPDNSRKLLTYRTKLAHESANLFRPRTWVPIWKKNLGWGLSNIR